MFVRPLLILALATPLAAQNPGQPAQPGYVGNLDLTTSYVPDSGIRVGSTDLGDFDTFQSRFKYTGTFISGGPVNWSMGFEAERFGFGLETSSMLPTTLGSVSLPLGVNWKINSKWAFLAEVSPGLYSDFVEINASDFNAPLIAGLSYAVNENFLFFLQLSLDTRRDIPIVGGPGFRWQMNRQWALSMLVPRPRLEFRPNDAWMVYAGAELVGGAYQLSTEHGTRRGDAQFDDVNMTYREIRAGIGAICNVGHGFRLEAAGGWVFDRRFVVDEERRQWNGEGAPYARLQLAYRY